jgi:hypothetical protein
MSGPDVNSISPEYFAIRFELGQSPRVCSTHIFSLLPTGRLQGKRCRMVPVRFLLVPWNLIGFAVSYDNDKCRFV